MTVLVLDTCALLWLGSEPARLSVRARELLSARDASLAVSAVSAWEIALKASKQRLRLPMDASDWWSEVLAAYQIQESPQRLR